MIAHRRVRTAPRGSSSVEFSTVGADTTPLFETLDRLARRHRVPRAVREAMHVGLDEVVTNVLRHGRFGRRAMRVRVDLTVTPRALAAVVTDSGRPFNPLRVPEPDIRQPLLERPIGGLGILLVKRLMDSVDYARVAGSNRLRLRKIIPRASARRPGRGRRTSR